MLYYLSQALWPIAAPSRILLLAGIAACGWAVVGGRRVWVLAAVLGLLCLSICIAPIGGWLLMPLEARFPQWQAASSPPFDGVIALGGDTGHRVEELARVHRLFHEARVVYTGRGDQQAAEFELRHAGLDPSRVVIESVSRTTAENAIYTAQLIHPNPAERWLLITSAAHMPRAVGCFRRAGFNVIADPVDFHTDPTSYVYATTALQRVGQFDDAAKEWIGLLLFDILGDSDALFPRP